MNKILKEEIVALLEENNTEAESDFLSSAKSKPYVIMVVGVNGAGKTTTIAKLAYQFKTCREKKYLSELLIPFVLLQ